MTLKRGLTQTTVAALFYHRQPPESGFTSITLSPAHPGLTAALIGQWVAGPVVRSQLPMGEQQLQQQQLVSLM